jgi:hypothetical protein
MKTSSRRLAKALAARRAARIAWSHAGAGARAWPHGIAGNPALRHASLLRGGQTTRLP